MHAIKNYTSYFCLGFTLFFALFLLYSLLQTLLQGRTFDFEVLDLHMLLATASGLLMSFMMYVSEYCRNMRDERRVK